MLEARNVDVFYGEFQALDDITIEVNPSEEWLYVVLWIGKDLL